MADLADAVLPLIRTRSEVWRWSTANEHGARMHEAVDILEAADTTNDPAEVYAVTHKALASAITVIARADDSSGIIGDACRRLLDLHPRAAAAAAVPAARLIPTGVRCTAVARTGGHRPPDFINTAFSRPDDCGPCGPQQSQAGRQMNG